mmetsp:Transcript_2506/g.3788  ORF Transcript_2506/g.3788 Transcript_2506/m.3788 type:complete len:280 (+) Transcript_2506:61-900(+)
MPSFCVFMTTNFYFRLCFQGPTSPCQCKSETKILTQGVTHAVLRRGRPRAAGNVDLHGRPRHVTHKFKRPKIVVVIQVTTVDIKVVAVDIILQQKVRTSHSSGCGKFHRDESVVAIDIVVVVILTAAGFTTTVWAAAATQWAPATRVAFSTVTVLMMALNFMRRCCPSIGQDAAAFAAIIFLRGNLCRRVIFAARQSGLRSQLFGGWCRTARFQPLQYAPKHSTLPFSIITSFSQAHLDFVEYTIDVKKVICPEFLLRPMSFRRSGPNNRVSTLLQQWV